MEVSCLTLVCPSGVLEKPSRKSLSLRTQGRWWQNAGIWVRTPVRCSSCLEAGGVPQDQFSPELVMSGELWAATLASRQGQ